MNNPMQMIQSLMGSKNPMQMLMQMSQGNPQLKQVLQMTNGKTPAEMRSMVMDAAKQRGINPDQLAQMAQQMGIKLPK